MHTVASDATSRLSKQLTVRNQKLLEKRRKFGLSPERTGAGAVPDVNTRMFSDAGSNSIAIGGSGEDSERDPDMFILQEENGNLPNIEEDKEPSADLTREEEQADNILQKPSNQ